MPPPGVGLNTVIGKVPEVVRSFVRIEAVNCVELTNTVVRSDPLNLTTEFEMKFEPLTVNVKPDELITTVLGEILVTAGTGLRVVTVKVFEFDVPPPGVGFTTVIE